MSRLVSIIVLSLAPKQAGSLSKATKQPTPLVREFGTHPNWPRAQASNAASPRALVESFFSAISAPKGGTLDRERLRSLFTPDGRIEIPSPGTTDRATDVVFMSPEEYASLSDDATANSGFFDHLIGTHIQQFGVMAHVYAAYESRTSPNDPKPFVRGVKSFELLNSAGRWYITQVSWDSERTGVVIPDALLHDPER